MNSTPRRSFLRAALAFADSRVDSAPRSPAYGTARQRAAYE